MSLKEALLGGVDHLETVELKKPGGEAIEVKVRPLSGREAAEVTSMSNKGLTGPVDTQGNMKINIDVGQQQDLQHAADVRAVRYGLSYGEEEWSDEEVDRLRSDWLEQLADVVYRISGMPRFRVSSFRVSGGPEGDAVEGAGSGGSIGDPGDGDAGAVPSGDSGKVEAK